MTRRRQPRSGWCLASRRLPANPAGHVNLAGGRTWKNCGISCWASMPTRPRRRGCSRNGASSRKRPPDSDEISRREDEILNIFVDICSLFRRKPSVHDLAGGEAPSTEAYLFSYSRMLETHGEGLPPAFVEALRRTLAHYGVTDAGPLARTGRELALDLQVAPTGGAASGAYSGLAGTASGRASTPLRRTRTNRSVCCLTGSLPSPAGCFPPSATSPANCAIAASSRRCLSRHVNRSTRKPKITSPILPPIRRPRTGARELTR